MFIAVTGLMFTSEIRCGNLYGVDHYTNGFGVPYFQIYVAIEWLNPRTMSMGSKRKTNSCFGIGDIVPHVFRLISRCPSVRFFLGVAVIQ